MMDLRFSQANWQRTRENFSAWWAGELARPLVVVEAMDAAPAHWPLVFDLTGSVTPASPFPALLDQQQKILESIHWLGDAFPRWYPDMGPGFLAAYLGAGARFAHHTAWFDPLPAKNLADIRIECPPDNPWRSYIAGLTRAALERWGGRAAVGLVDLGGTLDILASLRGSERLLTDLIDSPDEVRRLCAAITRFWLDCFDELCALTQPANRGTCGWPPLWAPGRYYMLQCDFAYMISPKMFEKFVLPDLQTTCAALDHPFYHLDGKGQIRHLDMLLSIENLRGIQWIPGAGQPEPEEWLYLLQRIRAAGKLCQVYVSRRGALKIIEALGGRGFLFCIGEDRPLTPQEAEDFLKRVQ